MKILHVNKFFFAEYGTEKYMFGLFDLLKKQGHEVIHFSMEDPRNEPSKQAKYFVPNVDMSKAGFGLDKLRAVIRMIHYPLARQNFAVLLDKENPDLIHLHSIHHQISPSILNEATKRGIPIVQTLHDYKLLTPGYHFPWRDGKICFKCRRGNWLHLIRHKAHKNSYMATLAVVIESAIHSWSKVYENNVDKFIVPSQDMHDRLVKHGVDKSKLTVAPHFLPDNYLNLKDEQKIGNGILFVGRLAEERGLDHVIHFAQNLPDQNFYLAGDGPERHALEAKIKQLHLTNIYLLGRLEGDQLAEVYKAAKLVVYPTQTTETFGLSILEAMAFGKPVIATNIGGVKNLIENQSNGFLYPANSPQKGLEILKNLLKDSATIISIGATAKDFANNYNPEKHLTEIKKVYDLALGKNKPVKSKNATGYKIAIMGHRGIPGNYGGFETFAEEIATRFVKAGNDVSVYCRTNTGSYRKPEYKGVRLIYLSTIANKYLDTLAHTAKSVWHAIFVEKPDVILMVNVGNTIVSWLPRLFGIPVILNVDGLEWERKKWNTLAKLYLRTSAWFTRWLPTAVVTDAKVIFDHYRERLGIETTMIPYGATVTRNKNPEVLAKYGLKEDNYYLYVARFEPENNAHLVVRAFEELDTDKKLVMIGDAPYASKYCQQVRSTKDKRIKFLGFVYGSDYKALQQNAYVYIQATEVGGTHPALIEGLGFGNCVLVNGSPENMETANGSAIPFWFFRGHGITQGLTKKLQQVDDDPELVKKHRRMGSEHIRLNYRWEKVAGQYMDLITAVKRRKVTSAVVQSRHA